MARAASIEDVDIPLIEEQVDTGLSTLMSSYRTNYIPGGDKKDDLFKRFTLFPSRPLPEFDHAFARAYEAADDFNTSRNVYAMVCDNTLPYRQQAITELTGFVNPYLTPMLGAGPVNCSHLNESRHVIFFERPQGTRLSDVMKTQPRLHEHKIIDYVLMPASRALLALRERKVSHGNIHPGTIFVGDSPMLGECVSMPCGTLGHYLYEPLERLMADPLGHGEANEKADIYALGILACELMFGLDKVKTLTRDEFVQRVIHLGATHVFTNNREFSDAFQDLFRGVLNDNPAERWGLDQLAQWINGKRFNMIAPSTPKEASRPLLFAGENFFSRRLLANALHRNWREAVKDIKVLKLDRWCETSLHRPELAERIERALRTGSDAGATERQVTGMMTRILAILDPIGPLRSMSLSVRPDAIGLVLADVMRNDGAELNQVIGMIENDLASFWVDQADTNKSAEISQVIWRLQRVRPYLKSKAWGFGLERTLYELNPSLCCQSPILLPYHITTALDALKTLDALASQLAPHTSLADRHIASFIAAKIDMGKEIRLNDLTSIPTLAENPELVVMRLLAKAQQKQSRLQLIGLSTWAAMRIELMIDEIHNRVIRKRLKLQLRKLAQGGAIGDVLETILNRDIASRDQDGFAQAIALYHINQDRIERLRNEAILEYKAKKMGGKMAMSVSYIALTITGYITLSHILGI